MSILSRLASISDSLRKLAKAFDPDENYDGKYMTAFYFPEGQTEGIDHCHVTHKYLAEQDENAVQEIIALIDQYFQDHADEIAKPKRWVFDKFDWFGEMKDTPVLRRERTDGMLLDLREALGSFKPDDFPDYKPHVTLRNADDIKTLTGTPIKLALVSGNTVVKEWPMGSG